MSEKRVRRILKFFHMYIVYFLLIAFVISSCMVLFLNKMMESMGILLTNENIAVAAKLTMGNVLLLSVIFTLIDVVRRKYMVERPVNQIVSAANKIQKGDFSVQIPHVNTLDKNDGFNEIIDNMNLMVKELAGTETLKTDFIANVSHELKTPLAVIQNYGTMLQSPELSEEERLEYAKAITLSTRKLADLITNILKLNKLENQQIRVAGEKYDLSEQLCECLLNFENVWESKGIEIDTEIEENVEIVADSELMEIVWNNLLSNAMKFTEAGGTVTVKLSVDEENAVVTVEDTGCGMDAGTGKHIFDKFYQGDTSHATQGNGLGLSLVKRIIDMTGNDISVKSQLGKGSSFIVRVRKDMERANV